VEHSTITRCYHNLRQQYGSVSSSSIDFDAIQQQLCRYSSAASVDSPVYTFSSCHPLVLESLLQKKSLTDLLPFANFAWYYHLIRKIGINH
jgi:hypothetical protein